MMADDTIQVISTPYDDVFRTLLVDCSNLIIPVINETFGEHYTGDEKIVFHQNEHYLDRQDGDSDKRISDGSFTIIGVKEQKYLFECQSTADSSMLIRIFEYATQIAIEQGVIIKQTLKVTIPRCAVIFLRSTSTTPEKMTIDIVTPGGEAAFDVAVIKTQKYTLDEIFRKNLLFFIPFYIFSYEARFQEYNSDEGKLMELKKEYVKIMDHLDGLAAEGRVSAYIRKTIIEMSNKVLENIAQKYKNVREGVRAVMGGRVLEHEAKTIFNEGELKGKKETAINLQKMGMKEDVIAKAVDVSIDLVKKWLGIATA